MSEIVSEAVSVDDIGRRVSMVGAGAEPAPEQVRAEFQGWLTRNWDSDLSLSAWRRRLVGAGWAAPSWPRRWHGRGLPAWADDLVRKEVSAAGIVGTPPGLGTTLAGPSILEHG